MGQAMRKLTGNAAQIQQQQKDESRKIIEAYIKEHHAEFETAIKTWDGFYHIVYEIVEELSEKSGAMQFKLPPIDRLEAEYKDVCRSPPLNKHQFTEILGRVVRPESFHVGQGATDIILYIFGIPVLALMAKRVVPGPTRAISDDVLIPLATAGTVLLLAKTNRL